MLRSLMLVSLFGAAVYSALTGKASQSSVYRGNTADRAIDGNLGRCAQTEQQAEAWWMVDLKNIYSIFSVTIIGPANPQHTYLNGVKIHIGNSSEKNGLENSICYYIPPRTPMMTFECNTAMVGRYVTVSLPGRSLRLCEVMLNKREVSPFELFNMNKTWEDALNFCRDKNMELASIVNEKSQTFAKLEAERADSPYVWLGLRYTCTLGFWFWVDDNRVSYTHWVDGKKDECDMSGAIERQGEHRWFSKPDHEKFNFICAK